MKKLVDKYLEYLKSAKQASPLTVRNYRHYLSRFLKWCESEFPIGHPREINGKLIEKYQLFLSSFGDGRGLGLKKVTQGYHLIGLRDFLRFLQKQGYQNTLSPGRVSVPKGEARSLKFLSAEQIKKLL